MLHRQDMADMGVGCVEEDVEEGVEEGVEVNFDSNVINLNADCGPHSEILRQQSKLTVDSIQYNH